MPPKQGPSTPNEQSAQPTASANTGSSQQVNKTPKKTTSNIEKSMDYEYTSRLLLLFTSLYDEPSIEEIQTLKDLKLEPADDQTNQQTRVIPFYSGVWDLKLRKLVDARIISDQLASDSLSEQVLQLREQLSNETPDLNDIFVPKNTERPQIPTYFKYLEEEEKRLNDFSHQRAKPSNLNFQQNSRIFTEKLRRQKASSKERAKSRFIKARKLEKEHAEFVNNLYKSQFSEEVNRSSVTKNKYKALQEQKEKQLRERIQTLHGLKSKSPRRPDQ